MRRRIGTCLLAVLMLAALAVPAFAAGLQKPVEVDASKCTAVLSGTDKVEVTVKDAVTGAQYLVFMLGKEGKPTEDADIQYIDQNGTGKFVVFPKAGMASGTYYIYVSSNNDARFDGTKYVATVEYASGGLLGDVNGDGKVNSIDALWVLQSAAKSRTLNETQQFAADVNKDGKVNSIDALWILQVAAKTRTL